MKSFVLTPLASALVGGALLASTSVAIAQNTGPSPELNLPTKGAFTCVEQAISLVSAVIDRQGCAATEDEYTLDGSINSDGNGSCVVDDTAVFVNTVNDTFRGTHQETLTVTPGEIDDMDVLDLDGDFWYSREGEIMYGDSWFDLCVNNCIAPDFLGREPYDEHVIKDFYKDPEPGEKDGHLVLDQGLEVITKDDFPRKKYRQTSRYLPPNGGLGAMVIEKVSIAPNNAPQCFLSYEAEVDDFGGGIQFEGTLTVIQL